MSDQQIGLKMVEREDLKFFLDAYEVSIGERLRRPRSPQYRNLRWDHSPSASSWSHTRLWTGSIGPSSGRRPSVGRGIGPTPLAAETVVAPRIADAGEAGPGQAMAPDVVDHRVVGQELEVDAILTGRDALRAAVPGRPEHAGRVGPAPDPASDSRAWTATIPRPWRCASRDPASSPASRRVPPPASRGAHVIAPAPRLTIACGAPDTGSL